MRSTNEPALGWSGSCAANGVDVMNARSGLAGSGSSFEVVVYTCVSDPACTRGRCGMRPARRAARCECYMDSIVEEGIKF